MMIDGLTNGGMRCAFPSYETACDIGLRVCVFTVNLLERKKTLLVDHIDWLRESGRFCKRRKPFHIDAWVVLPDHIHCIWTLLEGDDDFSNMEVD